MDAETSEDNVARLRRWFEEVWNQRRRDVIDELMSPTCRVHGINDEVTDRDGFVAAWNSLLEVFPDLYIGVSDVIGEGNKTTVRIDCTGTHLGHGLGMPPTGKPVVFTAMSFTRWEGGQIVEGWNVIDMASVYRQISDEPSGETA